MAVGSGPCWRQTVRAPWRAGGGLRRAPAGSCRARAAGARPATTAAGRGWPRSPARPPAPGVCRSSCTARRPDSICPSTMRPRPHGAPDFGRGRRIEAVAVAVPCALLQVLRHGLVPPDARLGLMPGAPGAVGPIAGLLGLIGFVGQQVVLGLVGLAGARQ